MSNVVVVWHKGCSEPFSVMSNLAPECALAIRAGRMKVEQASRALKSLLHLDKLSHPRCPAHPCAGFAGVS